MTEAARADILLVDDTPANLHVLAAILSQQGYRVRTAINGDIALRAVQKTLPDLIVLDVQMPGINGFEVCRQLKHAEHSRDVPVIFISSLEDALGKVEAFQSGGADYITKPFQIEEVLARVEHQIALYRHRAALGQIRASADALAQAVESIQSGAADPEALLAEIAAHARQIQAALGGDR